MFCISLSDEEEKGVREREKPSSQRDTYREKSRSRPPHGELHGETSDHTHHPLTSLESE